MDLFSNKIFKTFSFAVLCSLTLTACDDDEIKVGVSSAAIGTGSYITTESPVVTDPIGGRSDGHYECEGGTRNVCESFEDYDGTTQQTCRDVYDSCVTRRWMQNYNLSYNSTEPARLPEGVSSIAWAKTFRMSHSSAVKLIHALQSARHGNGEPLRTLGLGRFELRRLARFHMPSPRSLNTLARSLNQDPQNTRAMVANLVNTAQRLSKQR